MSDYLLIESRDPFESNDVGYYYTLARGLKDAGNKVTVFLVQNAVLAARKGAKVPHVKELVGAGIPVLADDFALQERGIKHLVDGVAAAPIDAVADRLEAGHKTLWH